MNELCFEVKKFHTLFGQPKADNLSKIVRHIYLKGDKNHKG